MAIGLVTECDEDKVDLFSCPLSFSPLEEIREPGDETTLGHNCDKDCCMHCLISTIGYGKGRYTIILAAMGDGMRLPLCIQGVCIIPELCHIPGVVVALSQNC